MPFDLIASGYPSLDYILRVSRAVHPGQTGILLDAFDVQSATLGGCGTNIAVACARLGLNSAVVMPIGNDAGGDCFKRALQAEGVNAGFVEVVDNGNTSTSFLFSDPEGNQQTFFYPGVAGWNELEFNLNDELAAGAHWGVITVGNACHNNTIAHWFERLRIPLLWSLRNDEQAFPLSLLRYLASVSRVLIMNEAEADELKVKLGLPDVRELFKQQAQWIFITRGEHGSRVISPEGEITVPAAPPVLIVDPTGAGDAFTAGVLYGLRRGADAQLAAQIGAVVSSFVLEEKGCQSNLPGLSQVQERYDNCFEKASAGKGTAYENCFITG